MRERRKALPPSLHAEKSKAIRLRLESTQEFKKAKYILVYISTNDEVNTHEFVKDCLERGNKVFVPKVEKEGLEIYSIKDWNKLKPGNFGILEPFEIPDKTHPSEMDLILVPGLAFDKKGHRVGYGGGFYDKLLKLTKGIKIGLAFEEQIVDKIPAEEHDVALDLIVTDKQTIRP